MRFSIIRGRLARRYAATLIVSVLLLTLLLLRTLPEQAYRQPAAAEAGLFNLPPDSLTVILLWTKYYSIEWNKPSFERNSLCPGKCFVTNDRRYAKVAAAVVFHASGMNLDPEDTPAYRRPSQYYIFFTQEPPPMTAFKSRHGVWQSFPSHFFNLTMTYRSDSDIHVPYDRFIPIDEEVPGGSRRAYEWHDVEGAIAKKTKMAIQFVGNCYSGSGRETIVRALQRYIELDRFGYCAGRKCNKDCEEEILPSYRFYIAFENNVCDEYVTEKFWRVKKLIVPIVLKASVMRGIAPNNSFIAVDQFGSVAALAAYLMRISRNDTQYAEYFEWTKRYQRTSTHWDEGFCKLCRLLHENGGVASNSSEFVASNKPQAHKTYADIVLWWYPQGICELHRLSWIAEVVVMWPRTTASIVFIVLLCIALVVLLMKWYKRR